MNRRELLPYYAFIIFGISIRLNSGDLAYLAMQCRKILDEAGLPDVKIAVSNQLDEYIIKSLLDQHEPIDVFGVGTDKPSAGGV